MKNQIWWMAQSNSVLSALTVSFTIFGNSFYTQCPQVQMNSWQQLLFHDLLSFSSGHAWCFPQPCRVKFSCTTILSVASFGVPISLSFISAGSLPYDIWKGEYFVVRGMALRMPNRAGSNCIRNQPPGLNFVGICKFILKNTSTSTIHTLYMVL